VNRSPAPDEVRTRYTKYEFRIPMRDGAHLFTAVYVPKDAAAGKTYPFLIQRTPYSSGPFGADNYRKHLGPAAVFEKDGFIFVYQDVRGRFMSEGTFIEMTPHKDVKKSAKDVDESTDAYDTIDWLVKNVAGNNGKAGLYGISYPGFFVSASMIDSHPALKACSPQAPVTDLYMETTRITTARSCWRRTLISILFLSRTCSRNCRGHARRSTSERMTVTSSFWKWVHSAMRKRSI